MGGKHIVVGTFFGIQLRIDYSWLIIFGLILWVVITGYLPAYHHGLSAWALGGYGVLVTVLFFASVIAHEYAHSIVANRRGLKIKRITLYIFGGASELRREPDNAKTELYMTAAGPLTSLVLAAVFGAIWLVGREFQVTPLQIIGGPVAALNLIVGLFNLLPAFPLDGGRILRALIWMRQKDFTAATRIASSAGAATAYFMLGLALLEMLYGYLLSGLWLALISFFLLQSARISYVQTLRRNILSRVAVKDVMEDHFTTVPAATSLNAYLSDFVLHYKQYDFVVSDDDEQPVGIIELAHVANTTPSDQKTQVKDYAQPLKQALITNPSDTASKVLKKMQLYNLNVLPVMIGSRLIGIVRRQNIEDYLLINRLQQANGLIPLIKS